MKWIFYMGLVFLCGCSTLTKDKFAAKSINNEQLTKTIEETTVSHRSIKIKDSSDAIIEFTLLPKGKFKLSPVTGFEGEAFSLSFKGKHSSLIQSKETFSLTKNSVAKMKLQKGSVTKLKEKQLEREGMKYNIGIFLLIAITIAIWYVWKKRVKR